MISSKQFRVLSDERIESDAPGTDLVVHQVMMDLVKASLRLDADFDSVVHRPRGLTYAGFRLLFCLWSAGPLQTSELARLLSTTPPTVSSVMNTLEQRGLLVRVRQSHDKRLVTAQLTPAGRRVVEGGFREMHERARSWMSGIGERDMRTFARVLGHLANRNRPPLPERSRPATRSR